jgi:hypothetical protein
MSLPPHIGSDPRVDALAAGLDDPTNAQALGAPAIIRGTVYAHLASGVTMGSGNSQAVQTATLAGLQAAVTKAGSLGKFFEIEPGTYEIYGSAGLVVPAAAPPAQWVGSRASILTQFASNAPVISVGDSTLAVTMYGFKASGFSAGYGVSQTGNTLANAIVMGPMGWCVFEDFITSSANNYFPYNSLIILPGTGTWFNNAIRDVRLYGGQQTLMTVGSQGSGSEFENIYMSNGGNSNASPSAYYACSLAGLYVGNATFQTISGGTWSRINIESVKAPLMVSLAAAQSHTFDNLHVENCQITGSYGGMVGLTNSNVNITGFEAYDVLSATGGTECFVFNLAGLGEVLNVDGARVGWSTNNTPALLTPLLIIGVAGNNDANCSVDMRGFVINDPTTGESNLAVTTLDELGANLNASAEYGTKIRRYTRDEVTVRTEGLMVSIIGATYTHYGYNDDAVLMVPAALAAACTITLSNLTYAAGKLGTSVLPKTSNTVRVRRTSGTYANSLTIKNAAGTTLVTNTTAAADYLFQFNGTAWVAAT